MTELLSARQFAERANVDEKQIRRALSRGLLHHDRDGKLDAAQLREQWRKPNRRTLEKHGPSHATDNELAQAMLVKARALADLRTLEYEQRANLLISKAVVEREFDRQWRDVRNWWHAFPQIAAPKLARELHITDVDGVVRALTELTHGHLAQMGGAQANFGAREP